MLLKTFRKGACIPEFKDLTRGQPIIHAPIPAKVYLPLRQGPGDAAKAVVQKGDKVQAGQIVAQAQGSWGVAVCASVSGEVEGIIETKLANGIREEAIVIASNGETAIEKMEPLGTEINKLSPDAIKARIRDAGIIGMGGAGFPTHVKLSPPEGIIIETVIVNGAECEPYLTCDEKVMESRAPDIVQGLLILMRAAGATQGVIGIKGHKKRAIDALTVAISGYGNIKIITLRDKYPQGDEKMLIDALIKKCVPQKGLPCNVGAIVNNVQTVLAVKEAVLDGIPLLQRVATITGSGLNEPKDLKFYLGTSLQELIDLAGGLKEDAGKVIFGGPMMGAAQNYTEIPVGKCDSGILVLPERESHLPEESPCIRCSRCVDHCPIRLNPITLANLQEKNRLDEMEKRHISSCIECGTCSYVCPAKRPLVQRIILGKQAVAAAIRNKQRRD